MPLERLFFKICTDWLNPLRYINPCRIQLCIRQTRSFAETFATMKFISPGIRYMLIASLVFSIMNVFVKKLAHIPAIEVVFFRALISLIISWWILKKRRIPVWGNNRKVLFLRGLFGSVSLVMLFATFQNLPLASAVLLQYLSPIFTALLAMALLGERLFKVQYLFFALCLVGIFLIKGFDPRVSTLYFGIGILAAFLAACAYTCIRVLKDSEDPHVIVFYFPLIALPFAGVISIFYWVAPQGMDWLWLLAIGVLTQIAQVFMTKAYQAEAAASVASVNYIGILYALGFGFFIFNETFTLQVVAGMVLVVIGVVFNVSFKKIKWIPKT